MAPLNHMLAIPLMELVVPLEGLFDIRYGQIICYPKYDPEMLRMRIGEMREMGIKAIIFLGDKMVSGIPILGKGYVGVVVAAIFENNTKVALKILRTDAEAGRLRHEADMLRIANSVGVGPKLLGYTNNFLMMEYIEGELLLKWVERLSGEKESVYRRISVVLREILEQCWRLDTIGLDHGELSWADKHIIINVNDKPYILDFETASSKRRTANVTSISQYLFIRGKAAGTISQKFRSVDSEELIRTLKAYKAERTRERFESILRVIGLLT